MKSIFLVSLVLTAGVCYANRLPAYYSSPQVSQDSIQSIQLKNLISDQLFDRIRQEKEGQWMTLFQKEQMKLDAEHALSLYSHILTSVKDSREKSKVYFRMGYLYEILSQGEKASEMYQKILSQSETFEYSKLAYTKFNLLQKRKTESLHPSQRRVLSIHQVQNPQKKSLLQTESHIVQARSYVTSEKWNLSLEHFKQSFQKYIQSHPCVLEKCSNFPSMVRSFLQVVDRKAPVSVLVQFQKEYLNHFPRDFLVSIHAAQTALSQKKYDQAIQFYEKYILLEKEYIRQNVQKESDKQERLKKLEPVFHLMQEVANQSESEALKIRSYDFYLTHSLVGDYKYRVFFLKNVALYNQGNYIRVAPVFRQISLSEEYEQSIREEAAVYALKSLVQLKQTYTAQKWEAGLSFLFPHLSSGFKELVSGT